MSLAPIAADLFVETDDGPRLVGARCARCGVATFPVQRGCPACGEEAMERALLGPRGTVWTWTTQEYPIKEPYTGPTGDDFEPFLLGYVELDGEIRVESRLVGCTADEVEIGMDVELVLVPFRRADGSEVLTFAFEPIR